VTNSRGIGSRNIWVGADKLTGQIWVYERIEDEGDPDKVTLFRLDNHDNEYETTYSDELGAYVTVNRVDFRKKLRTVDEETRTKCIETYEWFKRILEEEKQSEVDERNKNLEDMPGRWKW